MSTPLPPLNPLLGNQVTSRQFSLLEMVERSWGSEYRAPDHRIYQFSDGRGKDSTDYGTTGIYRPPGFIPPEGYPE
jgi:hypothetical protein